ncbi:hypothetical protein SDC9_90544 [bioreactor metagenome]|uniref:Uncharacterized protein n=1 Tax=bioreactor metagenome TaxID=1076179 RepID=A0A644ZSY6_9ZZZZ
MFGAEVEGPGRRRDAAADPFTVVGNQQQRRFVEPGSRFDPALDPAALLDEVAQYRAGGIVQPAVLFGGGRSAARPREEPSDRIHAVHYCVGDLIDCPHASPAVPPAATGGIWARPARGQLAANKSGYHGFTPTARMSQSG